MSRLISICYDWMKEHKNILWLSCILITAALAILTVKQRYKEDISDFLPLNSKYNKAMKVYQEIAGANRVVTLFQHTDSLNPDPDTIVESIERFVMTLEEEDKQQMVKNMVTQVDLENITDITDFVYDNIPYFLDKNDYQRFDSLMQNPLFVKEQIKKDKEMLMLPVTGLFQQNIQKDPLGIFAPVMKKMQKKQLDINYETYDGYIFSEDYSRAVVTFDSPFGASETDKNAQLLQMLQKVAQSTKKEIPNIDIRFVGGPVIAVGNSSQIKADSVFSVLLAVILIVALLLTVFRNIRSLVLIVVSIAWGWLFAMGGLALVHDKISVIVIGISSVIIGIAVNYPLHIIAHLNHTSDIKTALKEIVTPLLVGNITTVGAFLALVPLKSVALRDLGLFSSFLLVGTILFVLLYLPHLIKKKKTQQNSIGIISRIGNYSFEKRKWIVWTILLLTVVFAYFSLKTEFDPNMRSINYMTQQQKDDMAYFQKLIDDKSDLKQLYIVSSADNIDEALDKSTDLQQTLKGLKNTGLANDIQSSTELLASKSRQKERISLWNDFRRKYAGRIKTEIKTAAEEADFADDAFDDFIKVMDRDFQPQDITFFNPLTSTVYKTNIIEDKETHSFNVIDVVTAHKKDLAELNAALRIDDEQQMVFDIDSLNSSIATNLSDDFNYIGWACGLIVFFFLWFSMGSIELAVISFIPMACSWVWILGIMGITGISFNVVNVILATFIFGQGDDYTIFMTEGCQYEYAYRKKMLASYKNSIIISALIMFIGIGTLIFAKHPALNSLAQVTIVGMFSVVLMAYVLPPLFYKWLVNYKGNLRKRPVYLMPLLRKACISTLWSLQLLMAWLMAVVLLKVTKPAKSKALTVRRFISRYAQFDVKHIPAVKTNINTLSETDLQQPKLITVNSDSTLALMTLTALSDKLVLLSNGNTSLKALPRSLAHIMDAVIDMTEVNTQTARLKQLIQDGYHLLMSLDIEDKEESNRQYNEAANIAELININILPVYIHGDGIVMPDDSPCIYKGVLTLKVSETVPVENKLVASHNLRDTYRTMKDEVKQKVENANYFKPLLSDLYRYKGIEITRQVNRNIRKYKAYAEWLDNIEVNHDTTIIVINSGWGELPILISWLYPDNQVMALEDNEDCRIVAHNSAQQANCKIQLYPKSDITPLPEINDTLIFIIQPLEQDIKQYNHLKPIIIN